MSVHTLKVTGNRGELTPNLHARVDLNFYQAGWHTAQGMVVTRHGPVTRLPGTLYMGTTKDQTRKARLLPFEFNEEQVYALEFGHEYLRFWTRDGYVTASPPTPYEIVTPYQEADLPALSVEQSADTVYVFCAGYRPQLLIRKGETDWELKPFEPVDGPYDDINETDNTVTLSATGHATPPMSSDSGGGGTVIYETGSGGSNVWRIFDRSKDTGAQVTSAPTGYVGFEFSGSTTKVVDHYWVSADPSNHRNGNMPRQWELQGRTGGSTWETLDSRDGETGWSGSETRFFSFENKTAYRAYRLLYSGGGGDDADGSVIGELALGEAGDSMPNVTATFKNTKGINNGAGFQAGDVGRVIRIRGADAKWRWLKIRSVTSTTVVVVGIYGHALPNTAPISVFRIGLWSDYAGWPAVGRFFEDRLAMGGAPADPLGVHMSKIGGYDQFGVSDPIVDDDALSLKLTGGRLSRALWFAEEGALLVGTGSALRSVSARDQGSAIGPDNVRQASETAVPASGVRPVEQESAVLFMDRYRKRLMEAAYQYEADGFVARELSVLNDHLFVKKAAQLEWYDLPHKFVVARMDDGSIVAFTYDRDQEVAGGAPASVGGVLEDMVALPGPDGTDLFMIVNRTLDGGADARYIERLAPFWREGDTDPPVYAASAFVYSGTPVSQLTDLTWLDGRTVGVLADGRDIGDATVTGGVLDIPEGIEASEIVVGLRLPWKLQTLRINDYGQQDGAALGRAVSVAGVTVDFLSTAGVSVGTPAYAGVQPLDAFLFEDDAEEDPDAPVKLRTGAFRMPVDDSWQNDGVFVMEGDRMYPVTVRALSLHVEGEP